MVQPTARPPFPGIKPEDLRDQAGNFTPETASEGVSRALRLYFEEFRRTPTKEEIASLQALILNHGSRHKVPASPGGEDPIDVSDLFDRDGIVETVKGRGQPGSIPELDSTGKIPQKQMGTGVPDTTTFLRGDRSWQVPPGGGGGDNIQVNGVAVTDANLNDTTPAAPANAVNARFQRSGSGPDAVSANVPVTPSGSIVGTGRTINTTAPLNGGGDLTADRTLTLTTSPAGQTPVGVTRNIGTTAPLAGGGDLSADRTLSLSTVPIASGGTGQTTQTPAFNALSPLTTKGDLVAHDGTNNVRRAVGTDGQVLTADSAQADGVKWATPSGGGGGGNVGTATLDFGAFPGSSDTSVDVTGQASILAESIVEAWIFPIATADHSADEHLAETIKVIAGNVVAATGFTIYGLNTSEKNERLDFPAGEQKSRVAGITQGSPAPSVGGQGSRIYGTWKVAWRWQ